MVSSSAGSVTGSDSAGSLPGLLGLLSVLGCILAYAMGLDGPVFFDDIPNLIQNSYLNFDGKHFDDWRVAILSNDSGPLHRPLAMFTFAINQVLAGELVAIHLKATNLAIHLGIGGALFYLFQALLAAPALARTIPADKRSLVAMLAAAIWLLHPLHVSTVLYVVQRMAQLSMLFVVLGLLVFTRYRLEWAERRVAPGAPLAAVLWLAFFGALAVLSKENGVLLAWLIVVVEVFLFRGQWQGSGNPRWQRVGWLLLLLPVLLVLALWLVDPEFLSRRYATREFTLEERVLTQGRVLWHYLYWLVVPNIIEMGFHHDDIPMSVGFWAPWTTGPALLSWVAVVTCTFLLRARYPLLAFSLFFFLVAHSMESSIWPLEMTYEHRNYLPGAAVALSMACGLYWLSQRARGLQFAAVSIVVPALLLLLLFIRAEIWSDKVELARHNVINHPASSRANFFYANALLERVENEEDVSLTEDEKRAYLVTSREYIQRMHQLDPQDMAALVMLYLLDSNYFPGIPDSPDWLARLQSLSEQRRLQASDRTALEALVKHAVLLGPSERAPVYRLLDTLIARYPRTPLLFNLRYQLQSSEANADSGQLLDLLQATRRNRPGNTAVYPYLVNHYGTDNLAGSYETIGLWMQYDPLRRDLPTLRRIFTQ